MTIADAACLLAERAGWPVFPVDGTRKRPYIRTGRDHAEHASRDAAQIRDWFTRWPLASIGIPTGAASGLVVVDADAKHDGERLLVTLNVLIGPLPRDMVVRTQSGGVHVYCAHPGGGVRIKSTAGALIGPGVDIRGDGGYVLVPPSPGYRWERSAPAFPRLPDAWLERLRDTPRVVRPAGVVPPHTYATTIDQAAFDAARAVLRTQRRRYKTSRLPEDRARGELLDRVLEGRPLGVLGSRDTDITRAAFIVGRLLPDIGPGGAEHLAWDALMATPVPAGDPEDFTHWRAKFARAYERGVEAILEQNERLRLQCVAFAQAKGVVS